MRILILEILTLTAAKPLHPQDHTVMCAVKHLNILSHVPQLTSQFWQLCQFPQVKICPFPGRMWHCNDAVWLQQSGAIRHTRNAIFIFLHDDFKVRILLNQMTATLREQIILAINFTYLNPCGYFLRLFHTNLHLNSSFD